MDNQTEDLKKTEELIAKRCAFEQEFEDLCKKYGHEKGLAVIIEDDIPLIAVHNVSLDDYGNMALAILFELTKGEKRLYINAFNATRACKNMFFGAFNHVGVSKYANGKPVNLVDVLEDMMEDDKSIKDSIGNDLSKLLDTLRKAGAL